MGGICGTNELGMHLLSQFQAFANIDNYKYCSASMYRWHAVV